MSGSTRRKSLAAAKVPKEDKSTTTPKEFSLCPRCKLHSSDYAKAINYINSCHDVINRMMLRAQSKPSFAMPALPNFLNILASLHADSKDVELDNVETLDELICSMSYPDSEMVCSSEEDENKKEQPIQQHAVSQKSSNIPRPVSLDRGCLRLETHVKRAPEKTVSKVDKNDGMKSARVNSVTNVADDEFYTSKRIEAVTQENCLGSGTPQHEVAKCPSEMLHSSCSVTPQSSPRDKGIQIYSSKRSQRRPSYKTKSEYSLKILSKNKSKNGAVRSQKKRMEEASPPQTPPAPPLPTKSSVEIKFEQRKLSTQRKSHSQPSIREETNEQVQVANDKLGFANPYEDSDIEPDDQQLLRLLNIRNPMIVNKHQRREAASASARNGTSVSQPDAHYVVKQKPIDFFTRRRQNGREELSDSDNNMEPERNIKEFVSESDIDDDAFSVCHIQSTHEEPSFIKMKPSLSRMSTRVSNMDLIAQLGKVKPEKDSDLRNDTRNVPFRQPRAFLEEDENEYTTNMSMVSRGALSSHSSDIKTDDEDLICTRQLDVYRMNHH